jgi:hypothetical protein
MTTEQRVQKLSIEYVESYTEHGEHITGNVGIIRYWEHCNHSFNSAYTDGGLFDYSDAAAALAKQEHPDCVIKLSIPDCVFTY